MKFMINGALTIGTLDGANVEIREEAGAENFFLFGLTEDEVERVRRDGYRPVDYIERNAELRAVLELIADGRFTHGDTEMFAPGGRHAGPSTTRSWRWPTTRPTSTARTGSVPRGRTPDTWSRMSILNTARSGKFSSDRAIAEYCDEIWQVPPMSVE